jgi:hypothetical protein
MLVFSLLLAAYVTQLQAGQEPAGDIETLALTATETPVPTDWPKNLEGTPINPFEMTPIIGPAHNAEGTPVDKNGIAPPVTPSNEELLARTSVPLPSPTPIIFANVYDFAQGLPDDQVWLIMVMRTDGYLDKYLLPASKVFPMETQADLQRYLEYRDSIFQLKPGEVITAERLLSDPVMPLPGDPLEETATAQAGTPTPSLTGAVDTPLPSGEPMPLYLPQLGN